MFLLIFQRHLFTVQKEAFFRQAKTAGVDGLLVVDCPLEELGVLDGLCQKSGIIPIHVITPSTSEDRLGKISRRSRGFLYYACRSGTAGMRSSLPRGFSQKLKIVKEIVNLPVVVGFGISNAKQVKAVLASADGVVIGSCFVSAIESGISLQNLITLTKSILS